MTTPLPRPHRSPHPCLYRDRPRPPRRCRPSCPCPLHCRGGRRRRRGRRLIMTNSQLRHKELFCHWQHGRIDESTHCEGSYHSCAYAGIFKQHCVQYMTCSKI